MDWIDDADAYQPGVALQNACRSIHVCGGENDTRCRPSIMNHDIPKLIIKSSLRCLKPCGTKLPHSFHPPES